MSERIKKAKRRYKIELMLAMALYLVVLAGAKFASKGMAEGAGLTALALSPMLPLLLAGAAFYRFFVNMDERERRVSADAAGLTLGLGILVSLMLGFLSAFGVLVIEDVMILFAPFLIIVWGLFRLFMGGRDC
ncbi:MAG: hypothetical protein KAH44_20465 [Oricola sp.]|jgi:hypothetical protein|nr:hypothetical protein [Oricola sp.]